jgi:hypothetical protein
MRCCILALLVFSALLSRPVLAQEARLTVGLDAYAGLSDIPGQKRPTDQLWAAQTVFTPSVVYGRYDNGKGVTARAALGVGGATLRRPRLFPQPVELWARKELKPGALTLGRFFAPFGQQEWQYEAKNGAQWESGGLSAALQERGRLYGRWSGSVAPGTTLGVSAASGRGFSYGSIHDKGLGLDFLGEKKNWRLRAESDRFFGAQKSRFRFDFAQLTWTGGGRVQPFVSRYTWHDSQSQEGGGLGAFRSEIVGISWGLRPGVSVETATARVGGRRVSWAQMRITREL